MGDTFLPTIGGSSAVGPGRGGHPYWTTAGRWRGLGQDPGTIDPTTGLPAGWPTDTGSTFPTPNPNCNVITGQCAPTSPQAGGGGGAAGSGTQQPGINWTQVIQAAIKGTSTVVAQQTNPFAPKNLPAGTSYQMTPYGTTVMTAGSTPIGTAAVTTSVGNLLPILLVGGVLVMMMGARR